MLECRNNVGKKCDVGTKVMYEGKHIHYSDFDNKPLCSYSVKLCKQRRLNGFAFCIRHVLEDKSAPFKQCDYVAKYNKQRCTNPIPKTEERIYCNSHLQVLGIVPKKERKRKHADSPDNKKIKDTKEKEKKKEKVVELTLINNHKNEVDDSELDVYTFVPSPPSGEYKRQPLKVAKATADNREKSLKALKVAKATTNHKEKPLKAKLQDKISKNKLKLEKEREKELKGKVNHVNKLNTTTLPLSSSLCGALPGISLAPPPPPAPLGYSHVSTSSFPVPPIYPTLPPYSFPIPPLPHVPATDASFRQWLPTYTQPSVPILQVRPKRPRPIPALPGRTNKPVEKLLHLHKRKVERSFDLYPLGFDLSDEEDYSDDDMLPWQQTRLSSLDSEDPCYHNFDISSLRNLRVDVLETRLRHEYSQHRHCKHSHKYIHKHHRKCAKLLLDAVKANRHTAVNAILSIRSQTIKTKNVKSKVVDRCSYEQDGEDECQHISLPFTRHCVEHIMYNEHQVLYAYCTAKFPGGVQCSVPVFDIINERPLCEEHARKMANVQKGEANRKAMLADGMAPPRRPRKKTKPSALTRPSKKKKKKKQRRNIRPQKPVPPAKPSGNTEMPITLNLGIDTSQLSPVPEGIDTNDITDHLGNDLSPDVIDKNLGYGLDTSDLHIDEDNHLGDDSLGDDHLDDDHLGDDHLGDDHLGDDRLGDALRSVVNKQLLDSHDLSDWPKLPDDLNDIEIFAGKNGEFAPTKEEEEELERALKEASEDVKLSLAQLTHVSLDPLDAQPNQGLPNLVLPDNQNSQHHNHVPIPEPMTPLDMESSIAYTVKPHPGQGSFSEGQGSVQKSQSQDNGKHDMLNHGLRDMSQDPMMTNSQQFNNDVSVMSPHGAPISPHGNRFSSEVPRTLAHNVPQQLQHNTSNMIGQTLSHDNIVPRTHDTTNMVIQHRVLAHGAPNMIRNHESNMLNHPMLNCNPRAQWNSFTMLSQNADPATIIMNPQNRQTIPLTGPPPYAPNPNFVQASKFNLSLGNPDQLVYNQVTVQNSGDHALPTQNNTLLPTYTLTAANTTHQPSPS